MKHVPWWFQLGVLALVLTIGLPYLLEALVTIVGGIVTVEYQWPTIDSEETGGQQSLFAV